VPPLLKLNHTYFANNQTPSAFDQSVSALDARTILIRWRAPSPGANALKDGDLDPLPLHVLQEPFATYEQDAGTRDLFLNHPFWTTEYVGAGPYRLERWEQGSHFEGRPARAGSAEN
jgi:hypothetical protein